MPSSCPLACYRVWNSAARWLQSDTLRWADDSTRLNTEMKSSYRSLVLVGLLASASLASAVTNGFFVPSWRGSASSEFGFWETFATPVGAPGNPANSGSTGAVLTQSDPNALPTGSGNIYGFLGISTFSLADSVSFNLGTVVLQTRTAGAELALDQVRLNYTDGGGAHALAPIASGLLDQSAQPGGTGYSRFWQWDLTGLSITDYTVTFLASGQHLSFDAMTLDVASQFTAVPEPSTATLGALGVLWLGIAQRLRKRSN